MSISAMVAVRDYSLSTGADYTVLLMIADQLNDDAHCSWASVETIATYARVGVSTAYQCIERLRERGELVTSKKGWRTEYFIPMFPEEPGYDPQPCTEKHVCNRVHTSLSVRRGRKPEPAPKKSRMKHANLTEEILADRKFQQPENSSSQKIPDARNKILAPRKSFLAPRIDPLLIPYRSLSREEARARDIAQAPARVSTSNLAEKIDEAETEPEQTPPRVAAVPPHDEPESSEQRALWRAIQKRIAAKMPSTQLHEFPRCHLYQEAPALFELKLAAGMDVGMFRSRYESLIVDALRDETQRSLVVLEIWR